MIHCNKFPSNFQDRHVTIKETIFSPIKVKSSLTIRETQKLEHRKKNIKSSTPACTQLGQQFRTKTYTYEKDDQTNEKVHVNQIQACKTSREARKHKCSHKKGSLKE